MLQLVNVSKHYRVVNQYGQVISKQTIKALDGINLSFGDSGLVSVIGASGSGKSTLMSVLAGLTKPERGSEIVVDGVSTASFTENQWNTHRNTTVGLIFQQYHLIEQLSVLDNVTLSLDLAGVSGRHKHQLAIELLTNLGLSQHIYKKPNTLSGGQKQRVAIARAIINKPHILLCDEPTGALDSATGRDIMSLLREISRDTLVIVVTHDMNIANKYSDRIVSLCDGRVVHDKLCDKPNVNIGSCQSYNTDKLTVKANKRTVMSKITALRLSCKNMFAKLRRTLLTTLACSAGILGVAMSMAVSHGFGLYSEDILSDAMYTRSIAVPLTTSSAAIYLQESGLNSYTVKGQYDGDTISSEAVYNVITPDYAEYVADMDSQWYYELLPSYTMRVPFCTYSSQADIYKYFTTDSVGTFVMPATQQLYSEQYTVKAGKYATNQYEVVLVTDYEGDITNTMLESLLPAWDGQQAVSYRDLVGLTINIPKRDNWFRPQLDGIDSNGSYRICTDAELLCSGECWTVTVVGVVQPVSSSSTISPSTSAIGVFDELYQTMLADSVTSDVMTNQMLDPTICVFTGEDLTEHEGLRGGKMPYIEYYLLRHGAKTTPETYRIFPVSMQAKDDIAQYLSSYNVQLADDDKIYAFDLVDTATGVKSEVVELVITLLTGFSIIAVVVSSIMIAVVAYTSVLEQKQKIGLLRSIGARRQDIVRIFNTENVLIGIVAGIIAVVISSFACPPLSQVIFDAVEISNIASMTPIIALSSIALSVTVNILAGLIPAVIASRQDPIDCLNTAD